MQKIKNVPIGIDSFKELIENDFCMEVLNEF